MLHIGKFDFFQKFSNFTKMKISTSRVNFIHVAKANLAGKHPKLATNRRNPKVGVLQFDFLGVPTPLQPIGSCSWVQGELSKGSGGW